MRAGVGFTCYGVLAIVLGVAYSWNGAAFVVVMGLMPALLIRLVAPNVGKAGVYYDWGEGERDARKR